MGIVKNQMQYLHEETSKTILQKDELIVEMGSQN